MANTQETTSPRGTPLPQKGASKPAGKLTADEKADRLDALKIVPQADTIPRLKQMKFHQLVERHKSASSAEKEAKREKDEAGKDIQAALAAVDRDCVMDGLDKVTIVNGRSAARVDAKLLYQAGVSEDVIARCTVMGNEFAYALISSPREKK